MSIGFSPDEWARSHSPDMPSQNDDFQKTISELEKRNILKKSIHEAFAYIEEDPARNIVIFPDPNDEKAYRVVRRTAEGYKIDNITDLRELAAILGGESGDKPIRPMTPAVKQSLPDKLFERTGVEWDAQGVKGVLYTKTVLTDRKAQEVLSKLRSDHVKATLVSGYVRVPVSSLEKKEEFERTAVAPSRGRAASSEMRAKFAQLEARTAQDIDIKRMEFVDTPEMNQFGLEDPGTRCPQSTSLTGFAVHANRIGIAGLRCICSQAPTSDTQLTFWKAVLAHSYMILDLTSKTDRIDYGVQRYFPTMVGSRYQEENLSVTCIEQEKDVAGEKKLKLHHYYVEDGVREKPVMRLHYRGWPDLGVVTVQEVSLLVNFIHKAQALLGDEPLWIHCRAGVGRSGTLVVALALAKLMGEGSLTRENYSAVIDNLIVEGRKQRGIYFVSTAGQYQLLHEFVQALFAGTIHL